MIPVNGRDMTEVAICAVARTPIGKFRGSYAGYSAVELGIFTVEELLNRAGLAAGSGLVDEVIFGQVLQAGAGQAPARQVALGAGLPDSTPAVTINKVCGSSLKAVMMAANSIRAGEYRCIIAGGMESMTNAPKMQLERDGDLVSSMIHDGLWDVYNDVHMGNTGEEVSSEHDISRESADVFASRSQQRAATAEKNGWFAWESFPVTLPDGSKLTYDEGVRDGTTAEGLGELKSAFIAEGRVTAGNASTLSDGASAVLVVEANFARQQGWEIIALIEYYCTSGLAPVQVMSAPIPAVNMLLERNDLTVEQVDIFEHNEAFAAASCAVAKKVGIPAEKFNLHGGAVALGHPLGSSGSRCLITMLGVMRRVEASNGIVTLCLGGGNAVAMLVKRV
jgi:acetyl-CoA C-acetyltransferase